MRSRNELMRSLPLPPPNLFTPYKFRGVAVSVESIEVNEISENGTITPTKRAQAVLTNHLESCRVFGIGRISERGELVSDELEDPETDPWFLIQGKYHGIVYYLIVNENDEYYPICIQTCEPKDALNFLSENSFTPLEHTPVDKPSAYYLLPKQHHVNNTYQYDWTVLSELDKQLVSEAVTTFLRTEFNP